MKTHYALVASDYGDVITVEIAAPCKLGLSALGELVHFAKDRWLPPRGAPLAMRDILGQHNYLPIIVHAGMRGRMLLSYRCGFSVVPVKALYPHIVFVPHDPQIGEITEWCQTNLQSDHQQIIVSRHNTEMLAFWPSLVDMFVQTKNHFAGVQPGRLDHFSASLFCFNNVNDAVLFKLRWIG